jgi:cold-inducible RNA-binding protein
VDESPAAKDACRHPAYRRNDVPWEIALAKRIYVGSLPYSIDDAQLEQMFAQHGQVSSVQVIMDRDTGQAKGFAFVEMVNDNEAEVAIKQLDGTQLGGRTIVVNEAKERQPNRGGGGGGGGRRF